MAVGVGECRVGFAGVEWVVAAGDETDRLVVERVLADPARVGWRPDPPDDHVELAGEQLLVEDVVGGLADDHDDARALAF